MQDIYDTKDMRLRDQDMLITLHDVARIMEGADNPLGSELRTIADRFSELTKAAANRKHWTGHE